MSFRDPCGNVIKLQERIFRFINLHGEKDLKEILNSKIIRQNIENKHFISSCFLDSDEIKNLKNNAEFSSIYENFLPKHVIEHNAIFFPSFSYEWPAEMLYSAAELTLELSQILLVEGLGLKDASPYNVLFEGTNPIFIDLLSIEKRDVLDPIWVPYAQLVRMFFLPLFLNKFFEVELKDIFLGRSEGIEIDQCYRYLKGLNLIKPLAFSLIILPYLLSKTKLSSRESLYKVRKVKNPELAKFILSSLFKKLKKNLKKLKPKEKKKSLWLNYMHEKTHYSENIFELKEAFINRKLDNLKPQTVLDIGCNTGHFSFIAASKGSKVVAIDYDATSIGELWKKASAEKADILPLVVNICHPSPSVGWRNLERSSFLKRAHEKFDMIFMLAVLHHMVVTQRIPMEEIAKMVYDLTKKWLVIEFVDKEDVMFNKLTRGRENLYQHIDISYFKKIFYPYFNIIEKFQLKDSNRWLFLMEKRVRK